MRLNDGIRNQFNHQNSIQQNWIHSKIVEKKHSIRFFWGVLCSLHLTLTPKMRLRNRAYSHVLLEIAREKAWLKKRARNGILEKSERTNEQERERESTLKRKKRAEWKTFLAAQTQQANKHPKRRTEPQTEANVIEEETNKPNKKKLTNDQKVIHILYNSILPRLLPNVFVAHTLCVCVNDYNDDICLILSFCRCLFFFGFCFFGASILFHILCRCCCGFIFCIRFFVCIWRGFDGSKRDGIYAHFMCTFAYWMRVYCVFRCQ